MRSTGEKQAQRAEEYNRIVTHLDFGLPRVWYGYRWGQSQQGLRRPKSACADSEIALKGQREFESLNDPGGLRAQQSELVANLSGWRTPKNNRLRSQAEVIQRELAVMSEPGSMLRLNVKRFWPSCNRCDDQLAYYGQQISEAEARLVAINRELQQSESLCIACNSS
ncbi:MAG: hypothetical protein U0401_03880 [Anaerolineae bacterium]